MFFDVLVAYLGSAEQAFDMASPAVAVGSDDTELLGLEKEEDSG
jgi:hypothetical protein